MSLRGEGYEPETVSSGGQDTFKSFICRDLFPEAVGRGNSFEGG